MPAWKGYVDHLRPARFAARYKVDVRSGCWLWRGPLRGEPYGYGQYNKWLAHRVSWEIHRGPIPKGLCVLHRCDVALCVNPAHLFLGTSADNTADMIAKGRGHKGGHPIKLTVAKARHIKALIGRGSLSQAVIAQRFGVSQSLVSNIKLGNTWRDA